MKQKFLPLFAEFIFAIVTEVPKAFFTADPIYRAMRRSGLRRNNIQRGIYNLRHRGIIKINQKGYRLTDNGQHWLEGNKYKYFRSVHKTWDKKWRLILFDIPALMNRQRHTFRNRLKNIGAYMLQKSVFVFPYPCEEEIGYWCRYLKLGDYVEVIITEHLGSKELYIKKHFNI